MENQKCQNKCPRCQSEEVVKNGHIHNCKQRYICKQCGRQFVKDPQNKPVSDEQKALIDKLLLEKIHLAGIARLVFCPSLQCFFSHLNHSLCRTTHKIIAD